MVEHTIHWSFSKIALTEIKKWLNILMISIGKSGLTTMYTVTNAEGLLLIYTSDSRMAHFVNKHSTGVSPDLRLRVGGDPGTKVPNSIWNHVRQFYK